MSYIYDRPDDKKDDNDYEFLENKELNKPDSCQSSKNVHKESVTKSIRQAIIEEHGTQILRKK